MANERGKEFKRAEQGLVRMLGDFRNQSPNLSVTDSDTDIIQATLGQITGGRRLPSDILELFGLDKMIWRQISDRTSASATTLYLGRSTPGGITPETAEATVEIASLVEQEGILKPSFLRVAGLDRNPSPTQGEFPRIVALTYDLPSSELIQASLSLSGLEYDALSKRLSSADPVLSLSVALPNLSLPYTSAGLVSTEMYTQTRDSSSLRRPWLLNIDVERLGENSRELGDQVSFDDRRQAAYEARRELGDYSGFEFSMQRVDQELEIGFTPDGSGDQFYSLIVPDRLAQ